MNGSWGQATIYLLDHVDEKITDSLRRIEKQVIKTLQKDI